MAKLFPPRGYTAQQYPLPHNFSSSFGLGATSATKGATSIPLIRASELSIGVEGVTVNPRNSAFVEETGASAFMGSIVPKLNFTMSCFIPEAAIATGVRHINFKFMPIYFSFIESMTASNDLAGEEVEDVLEMVHTVGTKHANPLYAAKLFSPGNMPLNTVTETEVFGDWDLSVDATYEGIVLDEELLFDSLQFFTNKGMISKAMGPIRTVSVRQDRPYFFSSNNFTKPSVKRMNPYTYCGMHVWVPQADSTGQSLLDSEITDIEHLHFNYRVRYNEWNPNFDQTAI